MAWALEIYNPSGSLLRTVNEATSPNPIMGNIDATVEGGGKTKQIVWHARQDLLQAPPRGIVRYLASPDATPCAVGVIVTCPPPGSPGSGPADQDADALNRFTAVGLEQLAKDSLVGPLLFEEDTDVAEIMLRLCQQYAHPALVVDPDNFPATGFVLSVFYSPERTLADALDVLLRTLPVEASWFVNTDREIVLDYTPPPEP